MLQIIRRRRLRQALVVLVPVGDGRADVMGVEVDVVLPLGGHDFRDEDGGEVAVVVLRVVDAGVGLADVAEEVDPVGGGDEAEGLGGRAEELGVVDDALERWCE